MSESSSPLIVTIRIKDCEELDDLGRTRLAKILFDSSASRLQYRTTEAWVSLTTLTCPGSILATVAAPLINTGYSNLDSIKNDYVARAEHQGWFGEVRLEEDVMPSEEAGWSKPVIYGIITHTNQAAKTLDPLQWFAYDNKKVRRNRKSAAYMTDDGEASDPYKLWEPEQYATYEVKKPLDPSKISKANTVAQLLEINVDVTGLGLPSIDCSSYTHREDVGFENVRQITTDLMGRLAEAEVKELSVWVDCIRVVASITRTKGSVPTPEDMERRTFLMGELDKNLSRAFSKEEREAKGLSPKNVELLYNKTQQELFRGNYVIGFETLIEHLEHTNMESYREWKNVWLNSALDDIYTKARSPMVGAALLAARYLRGTSVYEETSTERGIWHTYDGITKKWKRKSPDAEEILQLKQVVLDKTKAISKEPTCNSELLGLLHQAGEIFSANASRTKMMKEMKDIVRVSDFGEMTDKNYSIMPVINGCIEVVETGDKRTVVFRPHKKQDFTTKVVGVKYEPYSWDHPDVAVIMEAYRKFMPDYETREFLLYWSGSCLWRGNRDRCIVNMVGGGGNGKTTFFLKVLSVIREFTATLKASAFYSFEKHAASADTEFMALKGAAIGLVEEIEPGKTGKVVIAKNVSGGGRIPLRGIFQAEEIVESTAKLIFVGNHVLHWPEDTAMVDRIYLVECTSRFSPEAPEDPEDQEKEHHYPMDSNFTAKLDDLAPAILWILIEYLKKYVALGRLPHSEKIAEANKRYWLTQNIYREFIDMFYNPAEGVHTSTNELLKHAGMHFHKHKNGREYSTNSFMKYLVGTYGVVDPEASTKRGYDHAKGVVYGLTRKDM